MTEMLSFPAERQDCGTRLMTRAETAEWLKLHDRYLILCHAHPDGDTLGAGVGLQKILALLGKTAHVICGSVIPERLAFLCGGRTSLTQEQLPEDFCRDKVISVDIASPQLMGDLAERFGTAGCVDLAIDHHGTHTPFSRAALIDPDMAACAEIIFDLGQLLFGWSEEAEHAVPRDIAEVLYAGMSTDSGSFKYSAVTPRTHHRAAVLLASGIEHAVIAAKLYGSRPMSEVMAAKAAYEDLRFFFDNRVSLVTFTEETMRRYQLRDEDIEDIVNLIRGIQGIRIAVHLKPRGADTYKLSLRSEIGTNVAEICARFGGGGHPCAAGCTITAASPAEAEAQILGAIKEVIEA